MSDFHALTGCDTISSFFGKGKKTARTCWQSLPDLTVALQALVHPKPCFQTLKIHLPLLEQFVTQLYGVSEMIPQLLMLQGTISSVIKANHFFKCPLVAITSSTSALSSLPEWACVGKYDGENSKASGNQRLGDGARQAHIAPLSCLNHNIHEFQRNCLNL